MQSSARGPESSTISSEETASGPAGDVPAQAIHDGYDKLLQ